MSDISLHHTLATAFSMGMVVLLSPEVFILALLMAAHRSRARLNSVVFFLGSASGLFLAIGIGLWITPATSPGVELHSWIRFAVRAGIGTALLWVGIYRAWQFLTGKDDRKPKPKASPAGWKMKFLSLFPSLNTTSSSPINAHYLISTFMVGFFTTGLHPKTSILAIAVGHQITRANGDLAKVSGFALFFVLALLPVVMPLLLAVFRPDAGPAIKEKCSAFLEKNGRWIAALICFVFATVLWKDALTTIPR
ncbi:MAG: GAP family protein [Verrucomicrobia bacterium]|nr:GAP family protein [Verrucomicrobiota bacterium]